MRLLKHLYVGVSLFFLVGNLNAQINETQQLEIDSLNAIISAKSIHDTLKVNAYLDLASYYYLSTPDISIEYCRKAEKLSEEINFEAGMSESYGWLGYLVQYKGDIEGALDYYQKCLKIEERLNNRIGMSITLNNIGMIYEAQGDIETALKYILENLEIRKELGDKLRIAVSYNNLGGIYSDKGEPDVAMEYFDKALILFKEAENSEGIARILVSKGFIYKSKGELDLALRHYNEALVISEDHGFKRDISTVLVKIGLIHLKKQNVDGKNGALSFGLKGLEVATEIGYPRLIEEAAGFLSDVYKTQNKGMKALEMKDLYYQMRDSVYNVKTQRAAIRQQSKYEYEKKKAVDDKENEKIVSLAEEKHKQQFIVLIIVGIASTLIFILLIIIYLRLRLSNKQKVQIVEQKEEVEAQRDQIEKHKRLVEEKHEQIKESITYAKRIQTAILPPETLMSKHLPNTFVLYEPKDVVAGDFYWLEAHDDIIFFAVADCTGHGVPGAMVSVICHNALNRSVREFALRETNAILNKVRELVVNTFELSEEEMTDGMDICLCAWNKKTNTLQYSGANNPLYVVKNNNLETIKGTKQSIGNVENPIPFVAHDIDLSEADSLYLASDGYADQFGGYKNKKFGYKKLRSLFVDNHTKPIDEQKQLLSSALDYWMNQGNDEQVDDICIMGVKLK